MQDNAPIHSAKKVQDWLTRHGIIVLDWPPYSPDLNPIEQLWYHLKKAIYKIRPDIEDIMGGEETIRAELSKALPAAWELIREDILLHLIESMDRRLRAVIKAKGWHTKY